MLTDSSHCAQRQNQNDPNIANIPTDHPFMNAAQLEQEATKLLQELVTLLLTTS
jgi:symplekin